MATTSQEKARTIVVHCNDEITITNTNDEYQSGKHSMVNNTLTTHHNQHLYKSNIHLQSQYHHKLTQNITSQRLTTAMNKIHNHPNIKHCKNFTDLIKSSIPLQSRAYRQTSRHHPQEWTGDERHHKEGWQKAKTWNITIIKRINRHWQIPKRKRRYNKL